MAAMTAPQPLTLKTYRCPRCGSIIFKAKLPGGSVVEHKCKCNTVVMVEVERAKEE